MSIVYDFVKNQYTSLPYPTQQFTSQTVIITGSNTGIGLEAARHIVRLNAARVILAVRSPSKGEAAARSIAESTGRDGICEVWELDMASYASIQAFSKRVAGLDRLDAVILNASIFKTVYEDVAGTESSVAVNIIGTFLLAFGLLPTLRRSGQQTGTIPVLTVVTSDAHILAVFNERNSTSIFDALADPESRNMGDRYNVTKLVQLFIIRSFAREMSSGAHSGQKVILNNVNPGLCHSELLRDVSLIQKVFITAMKAALARTTEVGSRNYLAGVSGGKDTHGEWISECIVKQPSDFVRSEEGAKVQERIWEELKVILERIQPGILENI